jgi:hypothetical protein
MKKSELLRALQSEIQKHNLSTFMDEKDKIVITGCTLRRKHFGTVEQFKRHITDDVLPPLLDKLSGWVEMKFTSPNIHYRVRLGQDVPDDMHSYTVEEWDGNKLLRTFAVLISQSQKLTHAPAESYIEKWFELYVDKLPTDGGEIKVNLNEVQIP